MVEEPACHGDATGEPGERAIAPDNATNAPGSSPR